MQKDTCATTNAWDVHRMIEGHACVAVRIRPRVYDAKTRAGSNKGGMPLERVPDAGCPMQNITRVPRGNGIGIATLNFWTQSSIRRLVVAQILKNVRGNPHVFETSTVQGRPCFGLSLVFRSTDAPVAASPDGVQRGGGGVSVATYKESVKAWTSVPASSSPPSSQIMTPPRR